MLLDDMFWLRTDLMFFLEKCVIFKPSISIMCGIYPENYGISKLDPPCEKQSQTPHPPFWEGPMMLRVCYSPEKLTYRPWKSNAWKTNFPFEMVPFWGDIRSSLGEIISEMMPQTEFLPGESPKGPMEGWCGRSDDDVPKMENCDQRSNFKL